MGRRSSQLSAGKSSSDDPTLIRLRGVRHNNLKNFNLDLPQGKLIVVTGLSGSGKSSLAFDTLFAEGQRRYVETFSPYARQFFDRMDKPQVDAIENIPPAIAIEQRNAVKSTRSTVGTMTELCDYMKQLWPHISVLHCRQCGRIVRKDTPQSIWQQLPQILPAGTQDLLVTFDLPLSANLTLDETLSLIERQGYQRLFVEGEVVRLEETSRRMQAEPPRKLTVVQDRVQPVRHNRPRFVEACEQAYHFGKGHLALRPKSKGEKNVSSGIWIEPLHFSNFRHCASCNLDYRDPSPALFSFNNPVGACSSCRGFGRIIEIDYNLAMPNWDLSLAEGIVKPWRSGQSRECHEDLIRFAHKRRIPTHIPFRDLSPEIRKWVIEGDPDYGKDKNHEWPKAWYGVKGYFRWLESKSYKMHVRVLLSRYRAYVECPDCNGKRFQPEALDFHLHWPSALKPHIRSMPERLTLADFYQLSVRDAHNLIAHLATGHKAHPADPFGLILSEVRARLGYLVEVGLGYLTLDRPTRSLSGGETERVNLTTCLGTRLVNTLFVLDEPSVGLHPRDTDRLVRILEQLRDAGNTVVVVEHEASVMEAANQIVDLGPGHGETGGEIVFQGSYQKILKHPHSLTGKYLSGKTKIPVPPRRPVQRPGHPMLRLKNAARNNLKNITVELPLERLVCITGVSGSGKTTLVRECLQPALRNAGRRNLDETTEPTESPEASGKGELDSEERFSPSELEGAEQLNGLLLVDQAILSKTPRSNPAVYTGAFDSIRDLFGSLDLARQRGLNASSFSFNSVAGQCERCRGTGFEKIEMQFLSDVFIRCPECDGCRYRPHILEVTLQSAGEKWNIANLLDAPAEEAVQFLEPLTSQQKNLHQAMAALRLMTEVGLGYLRLGQPLNTLSGGESQRLKLVRHMAHYGSRRQAGQGGVLYIFDEPTTGLHFSDMQQLLHVFHRLVDEGNTVLVIEHQMDVVKNADWLIDLGPEAGEEGGHLVVAGTPEDAAAHPRSHTGVALRNVLPLGRQRK